jgi:hypothetical protein
MLISALWCGFGRKSVSSPRVISTAFQTRIRLWNQKNYRRSAHTSLISLSNLSIIISCLSFGVNWSSFISEIRSIGFLTADVALICSIFAYILKENKKNFCSSFEVIIYPLGNLLLTTIVLVEFKGIFDVSAVPFIHLKWVDVLTPPCLLFITIWLKILFKDQRIVKIIPYIAVPLILVSLTPLSFIHFDQFYAHLLAICSLAYPHLVVLSFYFCSIGALTLYLLLWSQKCIPIAHQPVLVILTSVTIGLLSTTLFFFKALFREASSSLGWAQAISFVFLFLFVMMLR